MYFSEEGINAMGYISRCQAGGSLWVRAACGCIFSIGKSRVAMCAFAVGENYKIRTSLRVAGGSEDMKEGLP